MEANEYVKYSKWCWENQIFLVPHPITANGSILKILLIKNGKEKIGEQKFTNETVYDKIKELYKDIFFKNQTNKKNL